VTRRAARFSRFEARGLASTPRASGRRKRAALLVCAGVALTLGVVSLFAASTPSVPSLARSALYTAGAGAASVAIGDLDGDGRQDIVTANYNGDSVSLVLNHGHGHFQATSDYRSARGPASVALGDLDGDGRPDVVTANLLQDPDSATVSVLLNRGDGRLRTHVEYRTGHLPRDVATADLNEDDKLDVVTANSSDNTVSVLLGRGDGTLAGSVNYPTARNPGAVALADLNGDRKPDIAVTTLTADSVSVLLNRGDGTFKPRVDYRTGLGPRALAIGDLNGDAKPDLVTANNDDLGTHSLTVLLNRGDGTFPQKLEYGVDCGCGSIAIGDLNGDRRPDIAIAGQYNCASARGSAFACIVVLVNRGGGRLQPFRYVDRLVDRYDTPRSLAIGDLNGDGMADLVTVGDASDKRTSDRIAVLLASTEPPCVVPNTRGKMLTAAKRAVIRAHCRVGPIEWRRKQRLPAGRVLDSKPRPPTVLPGGSTVALITATGPLLSPLPNARVGASPLLVWTPVKKARYYNVQLVRGTKILSAWPRHAFFRVPRSWVFQGHRYRLTPGVYRWYVWPGYGRASAAKYGPALGDSSFVVVA
jgi:hypothetical protein